MESEENRNIARNAMQEMTGFILEPKACPNTENAWDRFNKRFNQEEKITGRQAVKDKGRQNIDLKWIYRVAAGFLIVLTAGLTVYFEYSKNNSGSQPENTVTSHRILTNYGEQKTIKLGDGSVINLNANSEMERPVRLVGRHLGPELHRDQPRKRNS